MTSEQAAEYAVMEQRVLGVIREHGSQTIYQLWACIALPEVQAMAEGTGQEVTSYADVAAAFWRLLERRAVQYAANQYIVLAGDARTPL